MEILIAATKTCNHRPLLEKELQHANISYKVMYFEDSPELVKKYKFKQSPLLIVDEKIVSRDMPETTLINQLKKDFLDISKIRVPKREKVHMIPGNLEEGLVEVDTTWGSIQPIQAARDVQTIGELEVYHHQKNGLPLIDARKPETTGNVTIPGSKNIPYDELAERMDELDKNHPTIFFCNGPQCPQSATAIRNLLAAGYPANRLLYYRGGMHDWITLGLKIQQVKRNTKAE